jgi:hypothetical protein
MTIVMDGARGGDEMGQPQWIRLAGTTGLENGNFAFALAAAESISAVPTHRRMGEQTTPTRMKLDSSGAWALFSAASICFQAAVA